MISFNNIWQGVLSDLATVLPLSPFTNILAEFSNLPYLGYINYFIPVGDIIRVTALWLGAIAVYYLYQILMRWLKVIS